MGKPLLTITTLDPSDRPTVDIDGVEYELAMPGDFSLREEAANAANLRKGEALLARAQADPNLEIGKKVEAEIEALLGGVIDVILRAPDEVRAKLRWRQQVAVIEAFGQAVTAATPLPGINSRSTSDSSQPTSRRRTASRRGSTSPSASSSPT